MSRHTVVVEWERVEGAFTDQRYSRRHRWRFDGGLDVPGSSSPDVVRVPYSDPAAVDPEEGFVAALSSCHMLTFLSLAARAGLRVDRYIDLCEAVMERNAQGREAVTRATLKPEVVFSGDKSPGAGEVERLHHEAHEQCFLANSVKTEIDVQGSWRHAE